MTALQDRRFVSAIFLILLAVVALATSNHAFAGKGTYYTGIIRGVAVGGYDPVAYFKVGRAVKGNKEFTTTWEGVKWRFSSAENRDAFLATPQKYRPQYGGYCAYAVAQNSTAKGNPRNWKVVDGKLYLNYNSSIQNRWEKRQSSYIKKANKNWPSVLK